MNMIYRIILTMLVLVLPAFSVFAAEADSTSTVKVKPELSVDLVSANLWRGTYVAGVSIQPAVGFSVEGFSFVAWASSDFNFSDGGYAELDFTAAYSRWGVTLSLTDYCWTNADGKFAYFGKYRDNHYLELGAGFDFSEYFSKVPISLGGDVMLYGANKTDSGETAYSTYLFVAYNQPIRNILTIDVEVGAAIERGNAGLYSPNNGFSVVNVCVGASKSFDIKGKININLGAHIVVNPATENVYFAAAAGFSI